jgi:ligand-binding sensor domain-containing protein
MKPVPGYGHGYLNVMGVDIDTEGSLWVSTNFSYEPVYRRKANGEWESIKLQYKNFGVETRVGDILATSQGQIWLLIQNDGILVFSADRENSVKERFFSVINQEGDLLDRVYSLAEDKEGNIWVGTNKGPAEFFNPGQIFDDEIITAYQPKIPRNDGTDLADLLLSTEKINTIFVNGANQKWVATEKSGVFLVSPDGLKEIHHFTEANSPLFSDNVLSLAVNDQTGEVFFGTDKGIVSYKGQATEGGDDFGKVYVFPNPVRETYEGDITVRGLARDVNVKFTDITGNLIYETKALGGQAIWNGRNFSGERVHTGVYLVFCTNEDGSKTFVTKLLFIH